MDIGLDTSSLENFSKEDLTFEQKVDLLETSSEFALHFVVDNQPDLIISELQAAGSENVIDSNTAFNNLVWLYNNHPTLLKDIFESIPYDNAALNYTGQMETEGSREVMQQRGLGTWDWGTIMSVVGVALPLIGGILGGGSGGAGGETQAQREERERLAKIEAERKARTNMILIAVSIAIVLTVVIVVVVKRKKK